MKTKKLYVISSKKFRSLSGALAQMKKWKEQGTLDSKATIYEIKKVIKRKPLMNKK